MWIESHLSTISVLTTRISDKEISFTHVSWNAGTVVGEGIVCFFEE